MTVLIERAILKEKLVTSERLKLQSKLEKNAMFMSQMVLVIGSKPK